MILESVRVENFKCIDDSTEFTIRSLTALVGKNESGKTALLKALYRVNPILPTESEFTETEYPRRRWAAYRQRRQKSPDRVVTTTWRLDEADMAAVAAVLGPEAAVGPQVVVTKGYDNRLRWQPGIDERAAAVLEARMPRFLYFAEYHRLPAAVALDELMRRSASNELTVVDTIFLALLELANTSAEELTEIDQFEYLVAELESVSQRITREVLEYWSQDTSLEVEFRCDAARPKDPPPFNTGYILRTRIRNRRHKVTLSFDERSAGFIWFFSFLVWLSHIRRDQGHDYIILLDEPGLGLHARAQMDMMRFIREHLLPSYQVVYTTHSPFMIDAGHLDGLRTVEDMSDGDKVLGTKVGDRFLSTDTDTLFPIRAALAYDVARRAVAGPQTLLVDRPSDVLYLKWFSRELQRQDREHLDPEWSLVPIGGLDAIAPFAALFAGQDQKIVVLTDGLMSHPRRLEGLWERGLLQFGRILRPALYVDREDAQVEDLLGRALYRELVVGAYELKESPVLAGDADPATPRVVAEVEAHFAAMPPWAPRFDSFAPASFLFENTAALRAGLPDLDEALNRFEKLFRDLNSLLTD